MIKSFSVDHLTSQLYVSEHCCQGTSRANVLCRFLYFTPIYPNFINEWLLTTFVDENPGLPFLSVFVSLFVSLLRLDLPVALTELKLLYIQGWSLLTELCLLLPMPVIEVRHALLCGATFFYLLNVATDFPRKFNC